MVSAGLLRVQADRRGLCGAAVWRGADRGGVGTGRAPPGAQENLRRVGAHPEVRGPAPTCNRVMAGLGPAIHDQLQQSQART
jgi:hypothetical protein